MNMPINRHPEVIATRPPSVRPEDGGGLINIAGVEIRGTPTFLGWIGGKNPAGQLVQGALKSARDEKGNWIFWLEGKGTNYLLKNDKGALITNQSDAKDRAREMIKWGEASDLRPLESEHVEKPSSDELKLRFQFLRYLGIPDLFLQVKLGTVDGRYAVQTKTGTYWVPSGLTTDKEIRDWLRSAIAADAISNAYPLGGLTPGERAAAQRYPETLRVDLEDPAINPRAGDGRGMMGRPDRFVPGLHSDYACKHACYIAERYGLTVKKWLEPTPHWHIQPKAHAVVEIPNTRQGGKIYARMNFEEVGYHGSQASPVAWVRPGELKLPPQASPAFIEGLKDEARAMGWQNVQVIGSMLVFGLLQAGAMRQRVRPPVDRSDGKPPSVGGLTIEMKKDPNTGEYKAVFPENRGNNKPPVRQTLPQIQPQTKPVPTVPPVSPVLPVSAPKPAPISPQPPPQRALPPHARHGDPFKPDPAQLRAERESVNVEYLPLKDADAVGTTQASTVGAELQWLYNQAQQQLQIEQLRNQRAQQAEQYGDRPQSPQQQQAAESPEQQRRNDIQRRLQRLAVEAPNAHQMLVWMCGDAKRDGWAVQKHFHLSFSTYMQYVNAINTYLGTNGLSDAVKLAKPLVLTGTDAPADSDKVPEITTQNFAALVDAGRVSRASSIDYANELLPAELFSTLNDDEAMLVGLIARGAVESREVLYGQPLNEALRRMGERVPDAARCIRSALDKLGARVDLHHQPGAANRALLHRLHQIGSDNFRNQLEMALGAQPLVEFGRYAARAAESQPRGRLAKPSAPPQPPQLIPRQERTTQVDRDRESVASGIDYASKILQSEVYGLLNLEEAALVGLIAREAAKSGKVFYGKQLDAALWGNGAHASDTSRCIRSALDKLGARVDLDQQGPEAASRALLHRLHQIGSDEFRKQLESAIGAPRLAELGRYAERADQFDRRIEAIEAFAPRLAHKLRTSSGLYNTRLIQAEVLLTIQRERIRIGRLPTDSELLNQLHAAAGNDPNLGALNRLDMPRLDKLINSLLDVLDIPYDPKSRNRNELANTAKIRNIVTNFSER